MENDRLVRLPVFKHDQKRKYLKALTKFEDDLEKHLTFNEMKAIEGLSFEFKDIEGLFVKGYVPFSLNGDTEDNAPNAPEEWLYDKSDTEKIFAVFENNSNFNMLIENCLNILTPRQRQVFENELGVGIEKLSREDLAQRMGITVQMVSLLFVKARNILRGKRSLRRYLLRQIG